MKYLRMQDIPESEFPCDIMCWMEEVPLTCHPTIGKVRNKRHRKRILKGMKRHGVTTFLRTVYETTPTIER